MLGTAVLLPLGLRQGGTHVARAAPGLYATRLNVNFRGRPAFRFHLRDARGGVLDARALRGRPYLITFLYTHCPDTCPMIGAEVRQALSDLGPRAQRVAAVGVSVDPAGDRPAAVRWWLRRLHEPANFHYLLGTQRQLAPVWNGYFVDEQLPAFATGSHTSVIYLVDAGGVLRGSYDGAGPIDPRHIAHDLGVLLAEKAVAA